MLVCAESFTNCRDLDPQILLTINYYSLNFLNFEYTMEKYEAIVCVCILKIHTSALYSDILFLSVWMEIICRYKQL